MVAIQPVNVFRAYSILISLQGELSREEAVNIIVERFRLSEKTAKIYIRALKAWGFLWGEDILHPEKPSLDEFIARLQSLIVADLGPIYETLKSVIESLPTGSVPSIAYILRSKGIDISVWKLRHVLRLLKQVCLLWRRYSYELLNFRASLSSIIYARIVSRGYYRLDKLLNEMSRELNIDRCEIKRILKQMILSKQILIDAPDTLIGIWIQSVQSGHCDRVTLPTRNYDAKSLVELKQLAKENPTVISFNDDAITIRVFEGNFLVIPLHLKGD